MSQYLHEQITKRDCPDCGGLGWYEIGNNREGKCDTCKGTGKVSECPDCGAIIKNIRYIEDIDKFECLPCSCIIPTYTDPDGFYIALQWAMRQEWFVDLAYPIKNDDGGLSRIINELNKQRQVDNILDIPQRLLNKETFSTLLSSYLKERDGR